jgi:hypothetical protein
MTPLRDASPAKITKESMPTQLPQFHLRIWQTIRKALFGIPLMVLALSAWSETESTTTDIRASFQHREYQLAVANAYTAVEFLRDDWHLKDAKLAIKQRKPLNDAETSQLNKHARMLVSLGAPFYKQEVPALYNLWDTHMALLEQATQGSHYQPADDIAKGLNAWRGMRAKQQATEAAAWVLGPTQVTLDPDLAPVTIPQGYRILLAPDHLQLKQQLDDIISHYSQQTPQTSLPTPHLTAPASHLLMPLDGAWSATLAVVKHRHIPLNTAMPNDTASLLTLIKSRSNPAYRLPPQPSTRFDEHNIRWLIQPIKDEPNASIQFAYTKGNVGEPLGIEQLYLKLGAHQQVVLSMNNLTANEVFLGMEPLPEGVSLATARAEDVLNNALAGLRPLLDSLQFVTGKRVTDMADNQADATFSIQELIAGEPSMIEQVVKRENALRERRENFWYFLEDHPRQRAFVVGMMLFFLLSAKAGIERFMQDDKVWVNILKRGLGLLAIVVLVVGIFLVLLPFLE